MQMFPTDPAPTTPHRHRRRPLLRALAIWALVISGLAVADVRAGATVEGSTTYRIPATSISTGFAHACVVQGEGFVRCWGRNDVGQLGAGAVSGPVGDDEPPSTQPYVDLGDERVTAISSGGAHTCALTYARQVRCWGENLDGQLGLGSNAGGLKYLGDNEPVTSVGPVDLGSPVLAVSVGEVHSCALLLGGDVRCWGDNEHGQLGIGTNAGAFADLGDNEQVKSIAPVNLGRPAMAIAAGYFHTCALLDNGQVKCWGYNQYGAVGLGTSAGKWKNVGDDEPMGTVPVVPLGQPARALAAGSHTCVILDAGAVRCWGYNGQGQVGIGTNAGDSNSIGDNESITSVPAVPLGAGRSAVAIAASVSHTCAVLDNGQLRCWGDNGSGQVGIGTNAGDNVRIGDNETIVAAPALNLGSRSIRAVSTDAGNTCVVLDNGDVRCWGANQFGQLGLGNNQGVWGKLGDNEPVHAVGPVSGGFARVTVATHFYLDDRPLVARKRPYDVRVTGVVYGYFHSHPSLCTGVVTLRPKGKVKLVGTKRKVALRGPASTRLFDAQGTCGFETTISLRPRPKKLRNRRVKGKVDIVITFEGGSGLLPTTTKVKAHLG